ncbi:MULTISPECIES: hypothetical protein [unclassified Roseofilum]|uniref:hypothetical protein n=1 Tax=unclassified Roseofilum TaxID=2620099 RepID=UPI000E954B0F|nr:MULTISPECIES: hypothetical protein [unclassified Roseofilum]MBP0007870.1 hypothetical protein [Roseofilum sp. Belize Diploria]MBP0033202.1 hypothetical protein [Roseofilum sp. Belize BBD 4]HBQ99569.1 hypothetical protein [Cyanobacteria bacterium UBA11691]
MSDRAIKTKVLITVMTYPHPSSSYQELICTAGITENYEWVRLYPIDYRYRSRDQQFRKYQWIEVDLLAHGDGKDRRKESRKPILETLQILGEPLSTKRGWQERRDIIDRMPIYTVKQLKELHQSDRTSLGIVRPTKVLDLKIEPDQSEWKPEWQQLFDQLKLFGPPQKPLRKIPYKFRYVFECEDSHTPHKVMITDWELGVLWLKEVDRLGDEEKAALSVRNKFFNEICSNQKDTLFFMGTVFPYNTWIVLGVFWPPKKVKKQPEFMQGSLF